MEDIKENKNVAYTGSSLEIDSLATALCKAQAEYPVIGKNKTGRFKFADKENFKRSIDPILLKYGLSVTAGTDILDGKEIFFMKLMHNSGQYQISRCYLDPESAGKSSIMQGKGSSLTYLSRYMYKELLGITIDDDPDDNDGEHEPHVPLTTEQIEQLSKLPVTVQQNIIKFNNVKTLAELSQKQYAAFKERFYKKKE